MDYLVGLKIDTTEDARRRRLLLGCSVIVNLGILGLFKYYNFFISSLIDAGVSVESLRLDIVLPVGISFYTFQTLSYTIDVYRRRIPACHDPLQFFAFVSFFLSW